MRRSGRIIGATLIATTGCFGGGSSRATTWRTLQTRPFNGYAIRFSYPPGWHRSAPEPMSSFSDGLAYLSTGAPRGPLPPGGIILTWTGWVWMTPQFARSSGRAERVGGWLARVHVAPPGKRCDSLGADQLVVVHVARSVQAHQWYQLDACLRGPGLAATRADIERLLRSTRVIRVSA